MTPRSWAVAGGRVRGECGDGDGTGGGPWTADVDARAASLEEPVRSVLDRFGLVEGRRLEDAARIVIVPDVHYPYHPSTGMVTDPAVVAALAAHLAERTTATLSVVGSSDHLDFERTARYLGYRSVLPESVSLVDLERTARVERTVSVGGEAVSIAVPDRLLESRVIVAPTLRPTRDGAIAGAMRALGRQVEADASADSGLVAVAATRAIDPAGALLDATAAYAGRPVTADALFAGECVPVDAVAAESLERTSRTPELRLAAGDGRLSVSVRGLAFEEFRSGVPAGGLPEDSHSPLAVAAYRRYADVTGDAVPPQLEAGARPGGDGRDEDSSEDGRERRGRSRGDSR